MTKFQEAIETYQSFMTDKLNMAEVNQQTLVALAEMLGPNIFDADASLVACSDKAELSRVKELFLIKELGLTEKPELDKAIKAVCSEMGSSNRKKYRVVFYYLLLQQVGMENRYTTATTTETIATTTKAKDAKGATKTVKAEPIVAETKAAPAPKTTVKTVVLKNNKVTAAPTFNSFDESYNFYTDYLYNEVAFFDVQPDLLSNLINTAGENSVVDINTEIESIKNNFLKGRLGCDESSELYTAINVVNERMANSPKYRPVFYYLLTKHLGREWVITQPAVANLY